MPLQGPFANSCFCLSLPSLSECSRENQPPLKLDSSHGNCWPFLVSDVSIFRPSAFPSMSLAFHPTGSHRHYFYHSVVIIFLILSGILP